MCGALRGPSGSARWALCFDSSQSGPWEGVQLPGLGSNIHTTPARGPWFLSVGVPESMGEGLKGFIGSFIPQ